MISIFLFIIGLILQDSLAQNATQSPLNSTGKGFRPSR